jgi:hypothetical protein
MPNASDDAASGGEWMRARLFIRCPVGDGIMRSNSGRGDGRNNMRDPTIRERNEQRTKRSDRARTSHAKAPADHRGGRKD